MVSHGHPKSNAGLNNRIDDPEPTPKLDSVAFRDRFRVAFQVPGCQVAWEEHESHGSSLVPFQDIGNYKVKNGRYAGVLVRAFALALKALLRFELASTIAQECKAKRVFGKRIEGQ
jgi:hypothetical protein